MLYFQNLNVWQKAMELAALSMPSNIAEGAGRKSRRDSSNFYSISKGSIYEAVNITVLLDKLNLIEDARFSMSDISSRAEEIVKMLHGLSSV